MIRLLLTLSIVVTLGFVVAVTAAHASPASQGAAWLAKASPARGDGFAADTLMALRAANHLSRADAARRAAALRRGAPRYATTAGATAKVILGLAASGSGNPRCAAGRMDLLARLQKTGRKGRYGNTIFDQTLGMMAWRALRSKAPSSTVRMLLRARGRGGWNFNVTARGGRRDDVSSTAMAIMALRASGVSARNGDLRAALSWMLSQRAPSGGFAQDRRDRTEANPTALAIEAARAMGYRDSRATRALRTLQRGDGSFLFTRTDAGSRLLATNDAVIALAGHTLPVAAARTRPGRC